MLVANRGVRAHAKRIARWSVAVATCEASAKNDKGSDCLSERGVGVCRVEWAGRCDFDLCILTVEGETWRRNESESDLNIRDDPTRPTRVPKMRACGVLLLLFVRLCLHGALRSRTTVEVDVSG